MGINRPWAFWRRVQYCTGFLVVIGSLFTFIYFSYIYAAPNCFDGFQNADDFLDLISDLK